MRQRDDGMECNACQNDLWVCERHGVPGCADCKVAEMPCPDCNYGLQRGWPEYDVIVSVIADMPVDPMKRAH